MRRETAGDSFGRPAPHPRGGPYCAITLGVGVDFAIHFLERWRTAAGTARERVLAAIGTTGSAIVADTAAVAFGFGVLGLSQVPANAALGLLVALALGASCGLTLVGLGAGLGQQVGGALYP